MEVRRALLTTSSRRGTARTAGVWIGCLLALALWPGLANALTIESFSTSRTKADGSAMTQAGAHPNLIASFALGESGEPEAAKDVRLGLPAGFFISPDAGPRCGAANFADLDCASSTQVGLITLRAEHGGDPDHLLGTAPVYALVGATGEIARYGFVVPLVNQPVEVPVTVRSSSDYGLDLTFANLPELAPLASAKLTLWAAPAAPTHDSERFGPGSPGDPADCPGVEDTSCLAGLSPVGVPIRPLLHNPTACGGTLASTLDLDTYQHPGDVLSANFDDSVGISGCDKNPFGPILLAGLTTEQTRSPSGLTLQLHAGINSDPDGIDVAQVKSVSVALPSGVRVDSTVAGQLQTCTDAQFAVGSVVPSSCPLGSRLGAFSMAVADLSDPLEGDAYFGTPEPGGDYRVFLAASGPNFDVKLVSQLRPDSAGEGVTLVLPSLPQMPLEELELELTDPKLLVSPVKCETKAHVEYTPWSSPGAPTWNTANDISLTSTGPSGGPCPGPATGASVTLSPASILAGGSATSIATATVADGNGIPVPGDQIVFASTDPGQHIGAVTENEDGTYSARITTSTAVGTATITATDVTLNPHLSGTATLTQLAAAAPSTTPIVLSPPPPAPPQVAITRKPPRQTHDRTPTFRFTSTVAGATFSCKVDSPRYSRCTSPKTLPKLSFGSHTFSVRATDPAGAVSEPVTVRFTVPRPRTG